MPVYVLDPNADDRELEQLLGYLKAYTTLTASDLIKMYIDNAIPYAALPMYTGETPPENTGEQGPSNVNDEPNYGINTAEDGTEYVEFRNKSLYAALLEYFGLDRWHGDYITPDMLKQIYTINVKVKPEYSYFYDNKGLREEFGLDCKYIEYTINGKTLDILPEKFMEGGVIEGHMENASLDIFDYFNYENGYYITKPDLSLEDKLAIYAILAWGGAIRMPVEQNPDGSYYTTMFNASPSIYLLGFLARYYDEAVYEYSDTVYMPNLQDFNVDGMPAAR
jgi:hypothetical protein